MGVRSLLDAWRSAPTCVEASERAVCVALSSGAIHLLSPGKGEPIAEVSAAECS